MKHATSRMLFSYWDARRGERTAPERSDIEPGAIRQILADIFILEIGASGVADLRLAGTRLCAFFGRELTGEPLHALFAGDAAAEIGRLLDVVVHEGAGMLVSVVGTTRSETSLDLEMLLLPLLRRGTARPRILGAMSAAAVPSWIGFDRIMHLTTGTARAVAPPPRPVPGGCAPGPAEPRGRFVVHQGGRG